MLPPLPEKKTPNRIFRCSAMLLPAFVGTNGFANGPANGLNDRLAQQLVRTEPLRKIVDGRHHYYLSNVM
jgi:hypothetical protein